MVGGGGRRAPPITSPVCLLVYVVPSIAALVASHEKAFGDIKTYYNEITHSNLDLIKTLKDEVRCHFRGRVGLCTSIDCLETVAPSGSHDCGCAECSLSLSFHSAD